MKRKISTVVLSCLTCIGMLAYNALPVQAIDPGTCTHPNFALGTDGPTGEYEYLEDGHYQVWGIGHACLKCGYEFYTDTHLVWDSAHELGSATIVFNPDGTTEIRYYCEFNGCPWYGIYE